MTTPDNQNVTIADGENVTTSSVYTESGNNDVGEDGGGWGCYIGSMIGK